MEDAARTGLRVHATDNLYTESNEIAYAPRCPRVMSVYVLTPTRTTVYLVGVSFWRAHSVLSQVECAILQPAAVCTALNAAVCKKTRRLHCCCCSTCSTFGLRCTTATRHLARPMYPCRACICSSSCCDMVYRMRRVLS